MRALGVCIAALAGLLTGAPVGAGDEAYRSFPGERMAQGRVTWLGTCKACHGEGFADAPPVADRVAWAPRIAKGRPVLYQHAIAGHFGPKGEMMPPRGGNAGLSDEQVRQAVDYMLALVTGSP